MTNLVGSWYPERLRRVVIGAHYDTRPFPDEERDPARRTLPFIGANDGKVSATSEGPGLGTTVSIELPVSQAALPQFESGADE